MKALRCETCARRLRKSEKLACVKPESSKAHLVTLDEMIGGCDDWLESEVIP